MKLLFPMLAVGAAREMLQILTEMPENEKSIVSKDVQASVLSLNHVTFPGNVLQSLDSEKLHAANWIVAYCPSWFEPCQQHAPDFAKLAALWQRNLNKDLFTLEVRFATVDCAIDKVLCNEQNVDGYPTLIHYQGGEAKAKWMGRGDAKTSSQKLAAWIQKRMVDILAGKIKAKDPAWRPSSVTGNHDQQVQEAQMKTGKSGKDGQVQELWRYLLPVGCAKDLLLISAAVVLVLRSVLTNPNLKQKVEKSVPAATPTTVAGEPEVVGNGVLRALPKSWYHDRTSVEL